VKSQDAGASAQLCRQVLVGKRQILGAILGSPLLPQGERSLARPMLIGRCNWQRSSNSVISFRI